MVLVFFFKNVVFRRGITPCAFFKSSKQFHFVKKELKLLWKINLKARICDSLKLKLVDLLKPAPNSMILCGSIAFHSSLYRLNKSPKVARFAVAGSWVGSYRLPAPFMFSWRGSALQWSTLECVSVEVSAPSSQNHFFRESISNLPSVTILVKV